MPAIPSTFVITSASPAGPAGSVAVARLHGNTQVPKMKADCAQDRNTTRDLTRGVSAWLLWRLPLVLLVLGVAWLPGQAWLWTAAFAVMGTGCLANAARCRRTHCYVTGPLFLLAATWCLVSALGVMPVALHPGVLIVVVASINVLAHLAEMPFGRYMTEHR